MCKKSKMSAVRSLLRWIFQLANIIILVRCVKIKIIDGPFSLQNAGLNTQQGPPDAIVTAKVDPQSFSGPPHLSSLSGKCFKLQKASFKYEFCPFHNVTQREQSYRWNAFHGVLGVWKEWSIVNDTFEYMLMTNGETCIGEINREVMVYFKCGNEDQFVDIQEPNTCRYNVTFQTPLACAVDAFMVYPILTEAGRKAIDKIEDDYFEEKLTLQGYNKRRRKLFIKEGLLVDEAKERKLIHTIAKSDEPNKEVVGHNGEEYKNFDKDQCLKEYGKLLEEVKRLRLMLESPTKIKEINSRLEKDNKTIHEINMDVRITKIDSRDGVKNEDQTVDSAKIGKSIANEKVHDAAQNHHSQHNLMKTHDTQNRESQNRESQNQESRNQESQNHDSQHNIIETHDTQNRESKNRESQNQESQNRESQNQESQNRESQNHHSRHNIMETHDTQNQESRNRESQNQESQNRESQNQQSQNRESQNQQSQNRESKTEASQNQKLRIHESHHRESQRITVSKKFASQRNKTIIRLPVEKLKMPRKGKMGDDGHSKKVPFKEIKKRKNGKMGDEGFNAESKKHEIVQGHLLGKFLETARKKIDLKTDEKSETIETHHNHLYH